MKTDRRRGHRSRHRWVGWFVAAIVAASTAAGAATAQEDLIGTIEGPMIVTDVASFPTQFAEAPILADAVAKGELPPLAERLPVREDLLVIKPVHEVGSYSDRPLRQAFTGPGDHWNGKRLAARDTVLFFDPTMQQVVPNVAKAIETSDDAKVFTITLRQGMKWSDGAPFTADDFVFWYEHIAKNPELGNSANPILSVNSKFGTVEKVDEVTVRYTLPETNHLFPEVLAGFNSISSHATWGFAPGGGGFAPAHYLKQFHPDFVDEAKLNELVRQAGVETWAALFNLKNDWSLNPELPTLTPWKTQTAANQDIWVLERNPYFFGVDIAGNQLPYLDEVVFKLIPDVEAVNFEALAGGLDFQSRHLDVRKLPLFLENEEKSGYKLALDPGDFGANAMVAFNMSYEADPAIAELIANRDFRRALALGIDRDQINETFFLGIGTSGSIVPAEGNPFNPGPEFRTLWATHDVAKANELLDAIGLSNKDSEGFRLRPDGQRLRLTIGAVTGTLIPSTGIAEMIRQHWVEIGIDASVQEMDRTLMSTRNAANENQMLIWDNGGTDRIFGSPNNLFPSTSDSFMGPLFGQWFASNGEAGKEPPETMRAIMADWRKGRTLGSEERMEVGKRMWATMADEVWNIGLVGLAPAVMGVRVSNTALGNVPSRQVNTTDAMTPGISRPETLYWKQ